MKLEALFQHPTALPTAPKVVDELISSFDKASVSTEQIAKKISADPVLSAKLLRRPRQPSGILYLVHRRTRK